MKLAASRDSMFAGGASGAKSRVWAWLGCHRSVRSASSQVRILSPDVADAGYDPVGARRRIGRHSQRARPRRFPSADPLKIASPMENTPPSYATNQ